jgi:hypothetical protein
MARPQQKTALRLLEQYAAVIDRYEQLTPTRQVAVLRSVALFRQHRLWVFREVPRVHVYRVIGGMR